jgi:putative redox protein
MGRAIWPEGSRICCGDQEGSVRLMLTGEDEVRLEAGGSGFEIVGGELALSPFHLMAGSLASCTLLTVSSWAHQAGLDPGGLTVSVRWELAADSPKRVEGIEMVLRWPGLPDARIGAAERAATACPIHATLSRAARVVHRVETAQRR